MPFPSIRPLLTAALLPLALAACSSPSLNVAPVVDLSTGDVRAVARTANADGMIEVQPGDTLFRLALANHVALRDLARWNALDENTVLKAGQRLYVRNPAPAAAVAAPVPAPLAVPSVPAVSPEDEANGVEVSAVPLAAVAAPGRALDAATAAPAAPAAAMTAAPAVPAVPTPDAGRVALPGPDAGWVWPVDGKVLRAFDGKTHKGVVLSAGDDAPVRAVADGVVNYVGTFNEYGKLVIITHADNLRSVYGYNKTITVQAGQTVHRGDLIATAGGAPGATKTRLLFEVRLKGVPVDPAGYLSGH